VYWLSGDWACAEQRRTDAARSMREDFMFRTYA